MESVGDDENVCFKVVKLLVFFFDFSFLKSFIFILYGILCFFCMFGKLFFYNDVIIFMFFSVFVCDKIMY